MDKLKSIFNTNRKIMVFLFCLFIISIIFGSLLPIFLNQSDKMLISDYLNDFVNNVSNYNFISLFFNGIFNNLGFCIIIFILGISIVGAIVVVFLFFLKGFVLGFSVSSIIINYGFKGVLFGFIYVFPHQIINIFVYSVLACYSITFSIRLLLFLLKKLNFNISNYFKSYFKVFCILICIVILSVLYESFILPKLLSFVFNFLGL